jgi:hypothetical protein
VFTTRRIIWSGLILFSLAAALPETAEAQRRRPGPRLVRASVVVVDAGYQRWYAPRFRWSQWGPYGSPYPPYGYGYLRDAVTTSVRLEVTPREAEVFVDGYLAGTVDDFDGIFQRLRLTPGPHEITIYLEGYRTLHESLYLSPGGDRKLRYTMVPLSSGEAAEPPPSPAEAGRPEQGAPPADEAGRRLPSAPGSPGGQGEQGPRAAQVPGRFGTLALRIQPGDAEILIDGERWETPAGGDRVAIQLAEGRHRVEVRKAGFTTYAEDVLIRRDSTLSLNVSLTGGPGAG